MNAVLRYQDMPVRCEEFLQQYAAGCLDEAQSLAMACYLTLNPAHRDTLALDEAVGGILLDKGEDEQSLPCMSEGSLENTLNRLEQGEHSGRGSVAYEDTLTNGYYAPYVDNIELPRVLAHYLPEPDKIKWKALMPGIKTIGLKCSEHSTKGQARLLKMAPGTRVPPHSHEGTEMTLVFDGSFHDEDCEYGPGDIAIEMPFDHDHRHTPHAHDEKGCICLIVTTAPPRLHGVFSVLNPFIR
jgi:putative transcriptional regulator